MSTAQHEEDMDRELRAERDWRREQRRADWDTDDDQAD